MKKSVRLLTWHLESVKESLPRLMCYLASDCMTASRKKSKRGFGTAMNSYLLTVTSTKTVMQTERKMANTSSSVPVS